MIAWGGAASADVTLSQSNDPAAEIEGQATRLLGQEHAALSGLSSQAVAASVPGAAQPRRALFGGITRIGRSGAVELKQTSARVTDPVWLAAQPAPKGDDQFRCLATALYFEARGEGLDGQAAVAEVILNRVEGRDFPNTICGVVNQSNARGCQFSFTCDGRPEAIGDTVAWDRAARIARAMIDGAPRRLTEGATHFHTPRVNPRWAHRFVRTTRIGAHIFYREPGAPGAEEVVADASGSLRRP